MKKPIAAITEARMIPVTSAAAVLAANHFVRLADGRVDQARAVVVKA
jgi:hypothetical protein